MQTFNLDISTPSGPLVIYAKQADSMSRFFKVVLSNSGAPWEPPAGSALTVRFGAAGMPAGWYDTITELDGGTHSAFSVDENAVTVEIAEQAVSSPGKNTLCLLINGAEGYQLASWNFELNIQAVPGLLAPEADVYYNALTEQVAKTLQNAQDAQAAANAAAQSAKEAAASASSINPDNLLTKAEYGGSEAGVVAQADKAAEAVVAQNANAAQNANTAQNANALEGKTLEQVVPNYSLSETRMPETWTDGKPIYRKSGLVMNTDMRYEEKESTVWGATGNREVKLKWLYLDNWITGVDKIISLTACWYLPGAEGDFYMPLGAKRNGMSDYGGCVTASVTDGVLQVIIELGERPEISTVPNGVILNCEYTKK